MERGDAVNGWESTGEGLTPLWVIKAPAVEGRCDGRRLLGGGSLRVFGSTLVGGIEPIRSE